MIPLDRTTTGDGTHTTTVPITSGLATIAIIDHFTIHMDTRTTGTIVGIMAVTAIMDIISIIRVELMVGASPENNLVTGNFFLNKLVI
jgi:hypothetical protein